MVPNVAKRGTSFKGACAYYLHDKKQEGERERLTDERVEWATTRNFHRDDLDPAIAQKIMSAVADDQDRLKEQAGIKTTGRKAKHGPVYAYSIAWHPEEHGRIDKAEMLSAVDQSLKALGAQDRQTIIVAHNDEPHPHVHVIVNLVSHEDGRLLPVHQDYKKLEKWALEYRKARGEETKYCPARLKKEEAAKARKRGEDVEYVRAEKSNKRGLQQDFEKAKAASNDNRADLERDRQAKLDAALGLETRSMHHRHKCEWADLSKRYQIKKDQIFEHSKVAMKTAAANIRAEYQPYFRDLYRRQYREQQNWEERDQYLWGKITNAVNAIKHRSVSMMEDSDKGWIANAFNFMTSREARFAELEALHIAQRKQLNRHEKRAVDQAISNIKAERVKLQSKARDTFQHDRQSLIHRQSDEKDFMKVRWKQRTEERKRVFKTIEQEAEFKTRAKSEQRPSEAMSSEKRHSEYKSASEDRKDQRKRSRSRGRSRKISRGLNLKDDGEG